LYPYLHVLKFRGEKILDVLIQYILQNSGYVMLQELRNCGLKLKNSPVFGAVAHNGDEGHEYTNVNLKLKPGVGKAR